MMSAVDAELQGRLRQATSTAGSLLQALWPVVGGPLFLVITLLTPAAVLVALVLVAALLGVLVVTPGIAAVALFKRLRALATAGAVPVQAVLEANPTVAAEQPIPAPAPAQEAEAAEAGAAQLQAQGPARVGALFLVATVLGPAAVLVGLLLIVGLLGALLVAPVLIGLDLVSRVQGGPMPAPGPLRPLLRANPGLAAWRRMAAFMPGREAEEVEKGAIEVVLADGAAHVGAQALMEMAAVTPVRLRMENIRPVPRPTNALVGVIDDPRLADQAVRALMAMGLRPADIRLLREPIRFHRTGGRSAWDAFRRPFELLIERFGEEQPVLAHYEEYARKGSSVLTVHADRPHQAEAFNEVLEAYGAHSIRHFGQWLITELPASSVAAALEGQAQEGAEMAAVMTGDIGEIDIFRHLTGPEMAQVAAIAEVAVVPEGSSLARQGEEGAKVYGLLEGRVQLTTRSDRGELTVRVAGPGESLPLAALLGQGQLLTTARAMTDLRAVVIPRDAFLDLCARRPQIGMKVYRAIADILGGRYRNTLSRLALTLEERLRQQADVFANV